MRCVNCTKEVERENSLQICENCADKQDLVWSSDSQEYFSSSQECSDCGGYESWCSFCQTYSQNCCVDYGTCACS